MKADLQAVIFTKMIEAGKAGKIAIPEDNRAIARFICEWNQDNSILVRVFLSV